MSDLKWQVKVLRELLAEAEKRMNEYAECESGTVELSRPCIAKTRDGDTVLVFRSFHESDDDTHQYEMGASIFRVKRNGRYYHTHETIYDIVEVVRLLTEKQIIDFQFNGIKPLIN